MNSNFRNRLERGNFEIASFIKKIIVKEKHIMDVWVLAGQSNMQGCAPLNRALAPDPRVRCFTSAGKWEVAEEPLHRYWESYTPVHQNLLRPGLPEGKRTWTDLALAEESAQTRTHGAGPGLAFGVSMADATGHQIGLLPAAHGGTTLEQWNPSGKEIGTASLYGAMLDRVRRAGGNLRGILWYQGESDAGNLDTALSYSERFATWISAVRRDLKIPDLPIIAVQIARRAMGTLNTPDLAKGWDIVRDAQLDLPVHIPNTAVVSAIDLGLCDTVHLDTVSQIRLGRRLAKVAFRMGNTVGLSCSPRMLSVEAVRESQGLGGLRIRCSGVTGVWKPAEHMSGFGIYQTDGKRHPDCWIINVSRDSQDGTDIRLLLNKPADSSTVVGYGRGADPYCNVVDESDLPLAAGALPVINKN